MTHKERKSIWNERILYLLWTKIHWWVSYEFGRNYDAKNEENEKWIKWGLLILTLLRVDSWDIYIRNKNKKRCYFICDQIIIVTKKQSWERWTVKTYPVRKKKINQKN